MTPAQLAPAQSAEVVWQDRDKKHKGWNVHLHVGAEVIKYHLAQADRGLADTELVSQAVKAAQEDGYELKPDAVRVTR
ncbi:MAG: hypothetical protein U0Q18_12955 [Bryobacteraceae bacterium]